jgi:ABC-type multidrug transport system ATPase subunit
MKIRLHNVTKSYRDRVVLNIENLQFDSRKVYAILGPNGSGKTTMLRLIAGIEKADAGVIYYNDAAHRPYRDLSYMPQKPYIFDTTVLKNVTLGMGNAKEAANEAENALRFFNMQNFIHASACSLSGGEAQKIAILRTLILNKKLVLMDEPTSAIDIPSMKLIEDYIAEVITKNGATMIFSTHNPSQASRMADEVIMLWGGCIVEKGPADSVLHSPRMQETKEFLKYWAQY